MEKRRFKALFLDMDGTFLDFHAAERQAFYKAFQKAGAEPTAERYERYSALNDSLWKAFERGEIEKQAIRDSRFTKLFEQLGIEADGIVTEQDYEHFLGEGHELISHAMEVLEYLAERYPLYVVTNGFANVQKTRLQLADIERFMTKKFISEQIGYQKPQKEFFDACFAQMPPDIAPSEVLLIGDSLTSDILGAFNAGICSCWFNPDGAAGRPGAVRKSGAAGGQDVVGGQDAGRQGGAVGGQDAGRQGGIMPDYEIADLRELMELL